MAEWNEQDRIKARKFHNFLAFKIGYEKYFPPKLYFLCLLPHGLVPFILPYVIIEFAIITFFRILFEIH